MPIEKWDLDLVHSSINFWVRHLMVSKVHGRFAIWSGTLRFDPENPAQGEVEIQIDASSIDTREAQRDAHLKSADFLGTEKHPHITFKSKSVQKQNNQEFKVTGDLTISGTSKPVTLDVEYSGFAKDPWGGERIGFSAKTSINRKDFGLSWNQALETGGFLVGDKIDIQIELEAVKAKA